MQPPLYMTDSACRKVFELIQEEGNFNLKLRVFVTGGGCSGLKYGFGFKEEVNAEDTVIPNSVDTHPGNLVNLVVDSMSFPYLVGAEIDYVNDIEGGHFIIRNPNSNTTCGCGSSFSVD